jgi:hypothetical protein
MINLDNFDNDDIYTSESSIRFLVSSSGTWTTVLLWFASSWVSDQEGSVILKQELLDLSFLSFVNEFLIVSDNSFGDGLSDSIDLEQHNHLL